MPQAVTIRSLPQAIQVIKEMEADGYEWGEDYRCAGGLALADILQGQKRSASIATSRRWRAAARPITAMAVTAAAS